MKTIHLFLFSIYFVIVLVWVWLANDGRLHWDEPAYLYTGVYFNVQEILSADFQPWDIEGFSFSRISHLLFIRLITSFLGPGMTSFAVISGCYLLLLMVFSWVTYLILRALMPSARNLKIAVILSSFTPVYVYLAFKTLPEIPAMLLASLAVLGFLRSLHCRPVFWLTLVAMSLAIMVLTKNTMVLLYAPFIVALLLCPCFNYKRSKIIQYAFFSGVGSLAIFFILISVAGIPLNRYLAEITNVAAELEPIESLLLHVGLEAGVFFIALPLSFLSAHRRETIFFIIWFCFSTLPLLFFFSSVEARYFAGNLIALAGLICLSMDGLALRFQDWWVRQRTALVVFASIGVCLFVVSAGCAQLIMSHEVRIDQFRNIIRDLDKAYGYRNYSILTPWEYSNFHYLRFIYPHRQVYTVYQRKIPDAEGVDEDWSDFQRRFYGSRVIQNVDQLRTLDTNLVYLGFEESFPIANLRVLLQKIPLQKLKARLEQKMGAVKSHNQYVESWMWDHPQLKFTELAREGHYIAMQVDIFPKHFD